MEMCDIPADALPAGQAQKEQGLREEMQKKAGR
jgi:hypothetical protein